MTEQQLDTGSGKRGEQLATDAMRRLATDPNSLDDLATCR